MNKALGDDCDSFTIIYLDDILIASDSKEEHIFHINYVLEKLKNVGFTLNLEKCEFFKKEIKFLGHKFDSIQAEMNDDTKKAIRDFETPRNKKGIQAFLGLINWDRRFIKNLATMTKPLEQMLCKGVKFEWTDEANKAFNKIKKAFEKAPKLYVIRPDLKFGLYVDASKSGLGAMLYQYDEDKDVKNTVAYASRSLKGAELNYTITELECLAIMWALRKWYASLLGRRIKIHTDHRALKFLSACADDSSRIARWITFLNEFDIEICHIPGKENVIADTLSRRNVNNGYAKQEKSIKRIAAIAKPNDELDTTTWCDIIERAQEECQTLQNFPRDDDNVYLRDGLVRIRETSGEKIIIPERISWELIDRIHDYILHYGTDKVADFANKYFKIKNLERLVRDVVASCNTCQATKYYTRPTRGVEYFVLPERPGKVVSIDIFRPLPQTSKGFKYILVVMDQFSKLTKLYPMKNQKLDAIMDALQLEHFPQLGVPEEILSDNGGQFITNRWREFAENVGFAIRKTTPYNPQSNPVERVMRELGRIIRVYAHDRHTSWNKIIPRTEKTINSTTHRSTEWVPLELHPEQEGYLSINQRLHPEENQEEDEDLQLERKIESAANFLWKRAGQRKNQADKHGEAEVYTQGQKVWVKIHRRSDASRRLTKKIHLVYDGPYQIRA